MYKISFLGFSRGYKGRVGKMGRGLYNLVLIRGIVVKINSRKGEENDKMRKNIKKVIFVVSAFVLFSMLIPTTTHAWSSWQNVSAWIPIAPGSISGRNADGQWRHDSSGFPIIGTVESQTNGTNACGVAVAVGTGTHRVTRRQGVIAHAFAPRANSGNRAYWNLVHSC